MAIIRFNFSEDVMTEILARLPVKSLLRFKCVCKSWYALIKNPSFISKHLNFAKSNNESAGIKYWNGVTKGAYVSFLSDGPAAGELSNEVAMPFFDYVEDDRLWDILFYGPCNGIICLLGHLPFCRLGVEEIALWNPATREIKYLPDSDVPRFEYLESAYEGFGFGFDTRSNDYKVVRTTASVHRDSRIGEPIVEVYSTITDSWRKLDVLPPTIYISYSPSPYLNGFCYWPASNDALTPYADANGQFVMSFDFADEVFEKIPLPDINEKRITLVTFNENTIAFADNSEDDQFSVWVMNMTGDGEKNTWTKLYTFMYRCDRMLGLFRGGEALILVDKDYALDDDALVLCDPNTQQCKMLKVYDGELSASSTFQMFNYVESLVSFTGAYELHPTG